MGCALTCAVIHYSKGGIGGLHRHLGIIAKHIMEGLGQNRSSGALIRKERATAKSVLNRDHMDTDQSKHKGCGGINHAHGDDYYNSARQNTRCSVLYGSAEAHNSTKPQPWQGGACVVTLVLGMCCPSLQCFSEVVGIKGALLGKKCHLWQWGNISNYLNRVHTTWLWSQRHISRIVKRGKRMNRWYFLT